MRIAFDIRCLQTKSALRGIGTCVRSLLEQYLVPGADELSAVVFRGEPAPHPGLKEEQLLEVPRNKALGHCAHLVEGRLLERALRSRGVEVAHHPSIFEFTFGALEGSRTVRTVATVFDLIPLRFREGIFTGRRRLLLPFYMRTLRRLDRFDAIVAPSKSTARDLVERCGIAPEKLHVIPLGIDARYSAAPAPGEVERFRARRGLPAEFALYVGGYGFNKNVTALIESMAVLRSAHGIALPLVLAGEVDPFMKGELMKAIDRHALGAQVALAGFVPQQDLPLLYRASLVFAFPTRWEGFGFPPLEAMACGVPVVASGVSSVPELVADGALLVNPESPEDMAEALRRIIEDSRLRDDLVKKGLARAAAFTWEASAEGHLALYRQLA